MPKSEEKRKTRSKTRKKNESLELLRAITKSMAGAVPGLSEEAEGEVEDVLARPVSGLMSQVMGVDPVTNEVKFPPLENLKRSWNSDERRRRGLPAQPKIPPGIITDTLSLPNILGNGPQFSQDAQELADATHQNVGQDMGLAPAQGFRQHGLEAFGTMLGQIPVASSTKAKPVVQGGLNLLRRYGKKIALSPWEFLSPTVEPKMSNYLMGAGAGGALGAYGDEVGDVAEEIPPPRAIARAKGGKIGGLSVRLLEMLKRLDLDPHDFDLIDEHGNLRIQEAKETIEDALEGERDVDDFTESLGTEDPAEITRKVQKRVTKKAKGGKVGALSEILRSISMNPDATVRQTQHVIGDPVEEVLHAANEGERKGVIDSAEGQRIRSLMNSGDEDSLADALIGLQKKLFPSPSVAPTGRKVVTSVAAPQGPGKLPGVESDVPLLEPAPQVTELPAVPARVRPTEAPAGHGMRDELSRRPPDQGEVPDTEWAKIRERMKGWPIQSVDDLENLLPTQTTEQLKLRVPAIGKKGQIPLDVLKNPKSQEDVVRWAGREVPQVRFMTDRDGNTYVWDATRAIHPQVMQALGIDRSGLFHEMSDTPIPPKMFDQYFFSNPWE